VAEQLMGQLRDREDVNEVEEQLHIGDIGYGMFSAVTKHSKRHADLPSTRA